MKKAILIISVLFAFVSCKSIKYTKVEDLKEIKMPFEEGDYKDTNREFFSIQSAKGKNMNLNRNRALMAAKTDLSGRIKTIINSIANQSLQFNNTIESESFDQKSTSVSVQAIEKILKVDSKTLRQKDGNQYDYWVVYKVSLDDVTALINASNLGFNVNSDQIYNQSTKFARLN